MTVGSPLNRRRAPQALLIAGVALIVTTLVLLHGNTEAPADAGALPALAATATTLTVTPTASGGDGRRTSTVSSPVDMSTASQVPSASDSPRPTAPSSHPKSSLQAMAAPTTVAPPAPIGRPAELHLPTLDVTASINPVDSTHGVLEVPDDISTVGWWQHSAPAGSTVGSTVLDGHIDSAVAGEGALFHLAKLEPGDPVAVTTSTGVTVHYRVQARRVYVKEQGLPADLFSQQGPGRLVIISCGGTFDSSIRSYEDNIAVFAVPTT